MKLSRSTVRKVMGGRLMTVSEIARAGGWIYEETAAFMQSVAVDEAEGNGGFERFHAAGVGIAYKWISGEDKSSQNAKKLKPEVQENIIIVHLKKHSTCSIWSAQSIGLSEAQARKTLGILFKRGILARKRSGSFNVYSLAPINVAKTSGIFG